MITYTWIVGSLHTVPEPIPNFVVSVQWKIRASDEINTVEYLDSSMFPEAVTDPDFIPYDQLTEAEVLNWVKNDLGSVRVSALEAMLATQLTTLRTPPPVPKDTPLPW
jgi:hypothetical protein